jgi:hypothetical protein
MNDFLQKTRDILDVFPKETEIYAYRVIDHLITELKLSCDAEDIARAILMILNDYRYLTYNFNMFSANTIIFSREARIRLFTETDEQINGTDS